jgi:hypothetical protein
MLVSGSGSGSASVAAAAASGSAGAASGSGGATDALDRATGKIYHLAYINSPSFIHGFMNLHKDIF